MKVKYLNWKGELQKDTSHTNQDFGKRPKTVLSLSFNTKIILWFCNTHGKNKAKKFI